MEKMNKSKKNPYEIPPFPDSFPVEAPDYFNFGYDVIDRWAEKDRNKLAMIWRNQHGEEKHFTFHDLSRLSKKKTNLLIKHDNSKGDRGFIMFPRLS